MNFKHTIIVTAVLVAASGCGREEPSADGDAAAAPSPVAVELSGGHPAAQEASLHISSDYMRDIVAELSDDKYEGRGPGSRGDVAARKYLAERLAELGVEPGAADGGWEQPFDLIGVNATQPDNWTFEGHDKSLTLQQSDQFIIASGEHVLTLYVALDRGSGAVAVIGAHRERCGRR